MTTTHDCGRMITTVRQRERRESTVMKQIELPVPAEDPAEVVRLLEAGMTEKTRLMLVCHIDQSDGADPPGSRHRSHGPGQRHPGHLDGAHALAHFDFKISDLECDNYSTSLHKWLFAPHGTGLLYVSREVIPQIRPLMAATDSMKRRYLRIRGDRHAPRSESPWAMRLLEHDRIRLHTGLREGFACGIGTVEIEGVDTTKLRDSLWNRHRILTVAIHRAQFQGLRISPSVYSTIEEVDRFVEAMEEVLRNGLPA